MLAAVLGEGDSFSVRPPRASTVVTTIGTPAELSGTPAFPEDAPAIPLLPCICWDVM